MQNRAVRQTDAELSRTASTWPRAVVALAGTARRREDNALIDKLSHGSVGPACR